MKDSPIEFEILSNNGNPTVMRKLIDLKNIFAKQLPKMPKEYIVRLIFNSKHESIVVKQGEKILGGICYCLFETVRLCEIVFLAISSEHQTKGFGTKLMNRLKSEMQTRKIQFMMTCADNLAIGYFKKQGFHEEILMPPELYKGYLKDYDGSTLMEFLLHPKINYMTIAESISSEKKAVVEMVKKWVSNEKIHPGVPEAEWATKKSNPYGTKLNPEKIEGLVQAGFDLEEFNRLKDIPKGKTFKESCLKVLKSLSEHSSAWPFQKPVKKEEVPDYFEIIRNPMDLQTVKDKVNNNEYKNKKSFEGDVLLIFENARTYNQKGTVFYKCADSLESFAKTQLANMKDSNDSKGDKN